jgi:hypothetical protein
LENNWAINAINWYDTTGFHQISVLEKQLIAIDNVQLEINQY